MHLQKIWAVLFITLVLMIAGENKMILELSEPESLGSGVKAAVIRSAEFGQNKDGRSLLYFVVNGSPARFQVVDAVTGRMVFTKSLKNMDTVWGMTLGADNNIYLAGTHDAVLYRYRPDDKVFEMVGELPNDAWVWSLCASDDYKIYGATYPAAEVFEYDILEDRFLNLGRMHEEQQYGRGLGISDEYLYVGIGIQRYYYRIKRKDIDIFRKGMIAELPREALKETPNWGKQGLIADSDVFDERLFARTDSSRVYVFHEPSGEFIRSFDFNLGFSEPAPHDKSIIYFTQGPDLMTYNLRTDTISRIKGLPHLPRENSRALEWLYLPDGRMVLAIVFNYGKYGFYDPELNKWEKRNIEYIPEGIVIQSIESDDGGRLYMGGYHSSISVYDIFREKIIFSEANTPQVEGTGHLDGKVFFGTYPGARILRYDPGNNWDYAMNHTGNPGLVYQVEGAQDRPFQFVSGDNHLFVGTVPGYGQLGGTLSVFCPAKNEWKTFVDIVKNQSIIGLAYRYGQLWGGTSIWGGLGREPSEEKAKLFIWDVSKEEVVEVFTPYIPDLKVPPKMIGEISFGPDGLLWGIVDGTIFALDPETREVKKSRVIYPCTYFGSKWRPYYLRWTPDGLMITTLGRKIVIIDPQTLDYQVVLPDKIVSLMTIAADGNIYFTLDADGELQRIQTPYSFPVSLSVKTKLLEKGQKQAVKISSPALDEDAKARVEYFTSCQETVSFNDGILIPHNKGKATVYVTVTNSRGIVSRSRPVTITVNELEPELTNK